MLQSVFDDGRVCCNELLGIVCDCNFSWKFILSACQAGNGDRVAFLWEGNDAEQISMTYKELLDEVSKAANMLKSLGVKKGDQVFLVTHLRSHFGSFNEVSKTADMLSL